MKPLLSYLIGDRNIIYGAVREFYDNDMALQGILNEISYCRFENMTHYIIDVTDNYTNVHLLDQEVNNEDQYPNSPNDISWFGVYVKCITSLDDRLSNYRKVHDIEINNAFTILDNIIKIHPNSDFIKYKYLFRDIFDIHLSEDKEWMLDEIISNKRINKLESIEESIHYLYNKLGTIPDLIYNLINKYKNYESKSLVHKQAIIDNHIDDFFRKVDLLDEPFKLIDLEEFNGEY